MYSGRDIEENKRINLGHGVQARGIKVPFFSVPQGRAPNTQSLGPVGSGPGLPESQGVKAGEDMKCLGNEFWNETYISEGAGQGWELRGKHLDG